MAASKSTVILGVDPGTVVMGYAVIRCTGQQVTMLEMDSLRMSWTHDVYERLHRIYNTIHGVISMHRPESFAIEAPFYGKNVQSMLKLGRAQGVALACALQHQLPVTEYSPKKVKQSITGNGNADKEQVWAMLQRLTGLQEKPKGYDASDALAVAVCHFFQQQSPLSSLTAGGSKGWEAFLRNNPDRLASPKK